MLVESRESAINSHVVLPNVAQRGLLLKCATLLRVPFSLLECWLAVEYDPCLPVFCHQTTCE